MGIWAGLLPADVERDALGVGGAVAGRPSVVGEGGVGLGMGGSWMDSFYLNTLIIKGIYVLYV